jgi:23S rRNA pseudouridine1911/1915/1917 synthase
VENTRDKTLIFHTSSADIDVRLDKYLSDNKEVGLSRARIQDLIKNGAVTVDGERKKPSYQLKPGERISIHFFLPSTQLEASEDVDFDFLYEDNSIVVVNKPPGLVVHPAAGHHTGTLVHGLLKKCTHLSSFGGQLRPGIVHRLDKNTSGVMVVAKNDHAHDFLANQFRKREVTKRYLAIVHGKLGGEKGIFELPIGRHPLKRKEMSVSLLRGRRAVTEWEVVSIFPVGFSLLGITIYTGRTHQIRVHLAYMGHPIAGDTVYGYGNRWWRQQDVKSAEAFALIKRQMLHAEVLGFIHPDSLKYVEFKAPLPQDIEGFLGWLRKTRTSNG